MKMRARWSRNRLAGESGSLGSRSRRSSAGANHVSVPAVRASSIVRVTMATGFAGRAVTRLCSGFQKKRRRERKRPEIADRADPKNHRLVARGALRPRGAIREIRCFRPFPFSLAVKPLCGIAEHPLRLLGMTWEISLDRSGRASRPTRAERERRAAQARRGRGAGRSRSRPTRRRARDRRLCRAPPRVHR